jgi:hypothetical protein
MANASVSRSGSLDTQAFAEKLAAVSEEWVV